MNTYVVEHQDALGMVEDAGAPVTFTLKDPGTYSKATGQFTGGTTTTVGGQAFEDERSLERYRALGLTESQALTLFFVPTTIGELPGLEYTVEWGGATLKVRDVERIAPAGTPIAASVVVIR